MINVCPKDGHAETGRSCPGNQLLLGNFILSGQAAQSKDQGHTTQPLALHWKPFELWQALHQPGTSNAHLPDGSRDLGLG